ncbi:MAG: hypothetical protein AB7F50_08860 [Fimbriimonadaceae bacterium]
MRFVLAALLLCSLGFAIGCSAGSGPSDQAIQNTDEAWKANNEKAMEENPPPPGEGPGN